MCPVVTMDNRAGGEEPTTEIRSPRHTYTLYGAGEQNAVLNIGFLADTTLLDVLGSLQILNPCYIKDGPGILKVAPHLPNLLRYNIIDLLSIRLVEYAV